MVSLPSDSTAEVRQTQRRLLLISSVHCSSAGWVGLGFSLGWIAAAGRFCFLGSSRPYWAYATPPAARSRASPRPAPISSRRLPRRPRVGGDGGAFRRAAEGDAAPADMTLVAQDDEGPAGELGAGLTGRGAA